MNVKNALKHLHRINKHKYYVLKNCFHIGLYKRGLLHDLSKYSPTEFFESVKYYNTASPITKSKEENGWSKAWQHHKGRNPHHWEYWIDNINNGSPEAILMPYEYAAEMLCDYIAAGQVYQGKNWTPQEEYKWWNKNKHKVFMHPVIYEFINRILYTLAEVKQEDYNKFFNKEFLKGIYNFYCYYYRHLPNHYRPQGENK